MATPDELKTMNGRQIARTGNAYSMAPPPPLGQTALNTVRGVGEAVVGKKGIETASQGIETAVNKVGAIGKGLSAFGGKIANDYNSSQYGALGGVANVARGLMPNKSQPATASTTPPVANSDLLTEQLTHRQGGITMVGGRMVQSPQLGGRLAEEMNSMNAPSVNQRQPSGQGYVAPNSGAVSGQSPQSNDYGLSEGKAGSFTYLQGPNGQIIKRDNTTGAMSGLQDNTTHNLGSGFNGRSGNGSAGVGFDQIKAAIDRGELSASEGLAMYHRYNDSPQQRAAAEFNDRINQLTNTAVNPEYDGTISGIGRAKNQRKAALDALGQYVNLQNSAQQNAMQREQMDSQRYLGRLNALNEAKRYGLDRERLKLDTQKFEQEQYQPVTVKQYDQGLPVGEQVLPFNRRSGKVINAPQALDPRSYVTEFMKLQNSYPSKSADELHAMIEEELKGGAQ